MRPPWLPQTLQWIIKRLRLLQLPPRRTHLPRSKKGLDLLQQNCIRLGLVPKTTNLRSRHPHRQQIISPGFLQVQHRQKCSQCHQKVGEAASCYQGHQPVQQRYNIPYPDLENKKKAEEASKPKEEKKTFKTKEGKLRCINQGCRKDYN